MKDEVRQQARNMIMSGEAVITHLYLDTKSKVTVGVGHLLPSKASTGGVNMTDVAGKLASLADKEAEWTRVRKIAPDGAPRNHRAVTYAKDATLFISLPEAQRLMDQKIVGFLQILRHHYAGFDGFPDAAQMAMLDMTYNLGNKIHTVFKQFTAAVNKAGGADWTAAAEHSHRRDVSNERNAEVKRLLLEAAASQVPVLPPLQAPAELERRAPPTLSPLAGTRFPGMSRCT